jgi:NAD(P)H-dependent flavin oxidoreductase YrpB (nitropropane dioxygenase family)
LWAGQTAALVHKVEPAADIVREINREATGLIQNLAR